MDSRTDATWNSLRSRKRWRSWREGRPLLGGAFLPVLRDAGADHAPANQWSDPCYLRLGKMLCAVFHSRERSCCAQAFLERTALCSLSFYLLLFSACTSLNSTGTWSTISIPKPSRAATFLG